jgi:diguanylate cyclase
MFSSATALVISVILGVVHLALGWLLGQCWPLWRRCSSQRQPDPQQLRRVAQRLAEQVASVQHDVSEHQGRMQQVNQGLAAVGVNEESQWTQSVLVSVAEILKINAGLQNQLVVAENKLQEQGKQIQSWMAEARTDPLTALPNRRAFNDALDRQIAQWQRKNIPFSLMVIDVDHFKRINDQYGHPLGDRVLRLVSDLFGGTLRRMDLIARIGGEEFAAILPSTSHVDACRAAEHYRTAVASHPFQRNDMRVQLTVSIGVACVRLGETGSSLFVRADQALYAAKQAGRNCVYLHNGRACEPAQADTPAHADTPEKARRLPETQDVSDATEPVADEHSEFIVVGDLLRDRLAEVIAEPSSEV